MSFPRVALRATTDDEIVMLAAAEEDPDTRRWLGEVSLRWHREALANPDTEHLSIVRSGCLVGFVVLAGLTTGDVELRRVVTIPAHRGTGAGRAAVREVIQRTFDTFGAHRLWLDVKPDNARARTLYASLGFVAERLVDNAVREPDGSYTPLLVMAMTRQS